MSQESKKVSLNNEAPGESHTDLQQPAMSLSEAARALEAKNPFKQPVDASQAPKHCRHSRMNPQAFAAAYNSLSGSNLSDVLRFEEEEGNKARKLAEEREAKAQAQGGEGDWECSELIKAATEDLAHFLAKETLQDKGDMEDSEAGGDVVYTPAASEAGDGEKTL